LGQGEIAAARAENDSLLHRFSLIAEGGSFPRIFHGPANRSKFEPMALLFR
jgi:hypothetical protein